MKNQQLEEQKKMYLRPKMWFERHSQPKQRYFFYMFNVFSTYDVWTCKLPSVNNWSVWTAFVSSKLRIKPIEKEVMRQSYLTHWARNQQHSIIFMWWYGFSHSTTLPASSSSIIRAIIIIKHHRASSFRISFPQFPLEYRRTAFILCGRVKLLRGYIA